MTWLTDPAVWEEVLQWALLGYLLTRTVPKPRAQRGLDALGRVKVTEEHLKHH